MISKMQRRDTNNKQDQLQVDKLRKMLLAMVSDVRSVLVKLAEQTCIMRGVKNLHTEERKRFAQETMDIYAPLANRLGIGQLKIELEDLAFHYLNPQTYKEIVAFLAEHRDAREVRIHTTIALLKAQLAEVNIHAEVTGRAKHIYSIYRKMQRKNVDMAEIYDASAVRILVPTVDDCYVVLSIVNSLWMQVSDEFDDYIATPKPNGYQSIHTVVIDKDKKHIEIQIRTFAMHQDAELGVAAHWLYKEGAKQQSGYEEKILWLRQLLDWQKEVAEKEGEPEQTYEEIFADRVYVFTPLGDIVDLQAGATPLDFAYHLHSELGNRTRGAKIHGAIHPLTYQLKTGDQVELITIREGSPSRDWLNPELGFLKTSRARSKVAQWFRQQEQDEYVATGKHALERELHRAGIANLDLNALAKRLSFKNEDALFAAIGHGNTKPVQIIHDLQKAAAETEIKTPALITTATKPAAKGEGVRIEGVGNLLTRIARCCKPIPGDAILGYITQGRGVSIHRADCNNMKNLDAADQHRLLEVNWEQKISSAFIVDIQIRAYDKLNLLREISATLANLKMRLLAINTSIDKNNQTVYTALTIEIHDVDQLKQLLQQLNQLPNVIDAQRLH